MFRIAICDDQITQLKATERALETYIALRPGMEAETVLFDSPSRFIDSLDEVKYDVVILDVCMTGMMGTDAARTVRKKYGNLPIIFISISRDFAVEAFALNAVHYLIKPFRQDDFNEAMDRALGPFPSRGIDKIMLKLRNGVLQAVDADSIIFIESIGYSRFIHTRGKTYEETRKTLSQFRKELEILRPGKFIQPYRGYIVNMDEIKTIEPRHMLLKTGDSILLKRGDFRKIREQYFQYSFNEEKLG